jgi:hypothetical protein
MLLTYFFLVFLFFFLKTILLYNTGWPPTEDRPASTSCVLGLEVCTTMPGLVFTFLNLKSLKFCFTYFLNRVMFMPAQPEP